MVVAGNVSGITGPFTGSFSAGPQAVVAAFDAVDAYGGICGRKLDLLVLDDGQDPSRNAADIADLIARPVFAFVGSTSDADDGGVQAMVKAGIPDVGFAINPNRSMSDVYWSASGSVGASNGGQAVYWDTLPRGLQTYHDFPTRLAVLSYNIPMSANAGSNYAHLFHHDGSTICYEDFSISPATASLEGDVIEMRKDNCNGVFTTLDVNGNAKLLQAMQQQNWHPGYTGGSFDTYTSAQITDAGVGAAQGFQAEIPFLPLTSSSPVIQQYESELRTYEPGRQPNGFGLEAWANAEMFIFALVAGGRNPTRAGIVRVFSSLDNWTTGGALSPVTPRLHSQAGKCDVELIVKGDGFFRAWPAHGLNCNSVLVPVGPAG
jgi:branched-chain amino acid transport system substrate-binding protein